ncbi:MAG: FHA domain-containing protein, partial [Myxococcota bacterium]
MPGSLNDTTTHALERPEEGWVPGSARPALIVVSAPDPEQLGVRVGLDPGAHVVGRSDPASLLVRDEAMSRRHFALEIDASGSVRIRDFGSRNGTFVNGERVDGARPLEGGVVRAGKTLFVWDTPVTKARLPRLADGVGEAIEEVVGWSLAAQALRDSVATVARPGGAVLVLGPTGTGKEVTARAIHAHS